MFNWKKVERKTPNDDRQVLALSGTCAYLASFRDGQWWLTHSIGLGDVTRWMEIPGEPKDFAYWIKKLREWWRSAQESAEDTAYQVSSWTRRNAQLSHKPVFFHNPRTGEITNGLPENMPAPRGYQQVVCGNVQEAERWSERQRQWDRSKHGKIQEDRERIEAPILSEIRAERANLIANARNNLNRDFLRSAQEKMEKRPAPWKYERESYLHSEGYEHKN